MAQTIITTDDLDGSPNAETVEFSFEGISYSIDLAKKNRAALEKALRPYLAVAEQTSGRRQRRSASASGGRRAGGNSRKSVDLAAVRAWARENGIEVSDRGRVSQHVLAAYNESVR